MLKYISAEKKTLEELSEVIKERNAYIKEGKYTTLDGGQYLFGDCIIVGENHEEAAKYLESCLVSSTSTEECIDFEKDTENMYDIQVWSSTEFSLAKVLESK